MMASEVRDLPEPDSPTTDRISPLGMTKEMFSTAFRMPPSVRNETLRLSTSSSVSEAVRSSTGEPHARVERRIKEVDHRIGRHDEE